MLHFIVTASKFHEKSLLENIIHKVLNKFQCDVHDLIVRNFIISIKFYLIILFYHRILIEMKWKNRHIKIEVSNK